MKYFKMENVTVLEVKVGPLGIIRGGLTVVKDTLG